MKNAIDKKIEMTAEERAFIDRFVADYCRPHRVVMAERLAKFVAERQMAFVSGASADFALAAGPRRTAAKEATSPVAPDEEERRGTRRLGGVARRAVRPAEGDFRDDADDQGVRFVRTAGAGRVLARRLRVADHGRHGRDAVRPLPGRHPEHGSGAVPPRRSSRRGATALLLRPRIIEKDSKYLFG